MHPRHRALTVPVPPQPQRLPPQLPLLLPQSVNLLLLLLPAPLPMPEIPRRPPLLAALVQEVGRVLLEGRDGEEGELGVGGDFDGAAGHGHGGEGFVGFVVVFYAGFGDREEVGFEVF